MAQGREPVFGLDLIRFAAALAVTAYHLGYKMFALPQTPLSGVTTTGALPGWWWLNWWGWIGVQVFFVLSGTVIAYSLEGATPAGFVRRRVQRLYPALLVCATIALPVAIGVLGMPPALALRLYAKTIAFVPVSPWLLGQFWTLPLEAMFYAAMWLLLLTGRLARLVGLAWLLVLASSAFWLWETAGPGLPFRQLSRLFLLQHGAYFALGIYLARPARFGAGQAPFLGLEIACAAAQIRDAAIGERMGHGLDGMWLTPFLLWLLAVAAIGLSVRWRRAIAPRALRHAGLLRTMGRMTYPLYLVHMEAGVPALLLLLGAGVPRGAAFAAALLASLLLALFVTLWLEPPMHRLVSGLLRARVPGRLRPA